MNNLRFGAYFMNFAEEQLQHIANISDAFEALCATAPAYFSSIKGYTNVGFRCARNRYLAGRIPEADYMRVLWDVYDRRDAADYTTDGGISFEAFCVQALAALHPPTYIHARMVSGLTECLCGHLLKRSPGRFVGALGCATIADVLERREALL